MTVTVSAPAKLNLYLKVLGRRRDGFHALDSLFYTIGLYDTLELTPADGLSLTCNDAYLEGPDNLALRAAHALNDAAGGGHGVHIHLTKRIPAGAGLGGGSSDAASVLSGLNRLWGVGFDRDKLAGLGAGLGSDVPFFIHAGAARVGGRGEVVTPLGHPLKAWCVLIYPGCHVATGAVFCRLGLESDDRLLTPEAPDLIITPADVSAQDAVWANLGNDLESAAREQAPEIGAALDALRQAGGRLARMSGSGSAVFCLTPDEDSAQAIQERLHGAAGWATWVVPLVAG